MFSSGPNELLQGFNNEVLQAISSVVNLINLDIFFFLALIIIMFAIDFKRGFIIVHAFFWTSMLSFALNLCFELPRPGDFDQITFNGSALGDILSDGGFPSILMSKITIFWLSLWHFYRQKWLMLTSILIILVTSVSLLYTGNQLLTDLLAGISVGLFMYFLIFRLIYNRDRLESYLKKSRHGFVRPFVALSRIIFLFIFPLGLLFVPDIDLNILAKLLGLNLAFYTIGIQRWPYNSGTNFQRMIRVLIAISVFVLLNFVTAQFIVPEHSFKYFFTNLAEMYFAIQISVFISKRTKLYPKISIR